MFKFDGVAGNPKELGMEMEAMLRTIAALRTKRTKDKGDDDDDDDDVWCLRCLRKFWHIFWPLVRGIQGIRISWQMLVEDQQKFSSPKMGVNSQLAAEMWDEISGINFLAGPAGREWGKFHESPQYTKQ